VNKFDLVPRLPAHSDDAVAGRGRRRTPIDVLHDVQKHIGATGYIHAGSVVELDSGPLASVRRITNTIGMLRAGYSNFRAAAPGDLATVAMRELSNAAHALLPHGLDAYEEKLDFFLRDQVSAGAASSPGLATPK